LSTKENAGVSVPQRRCSLRSAALQWCRLTVRLRQQDLSTLTSLQCLLTWSIIPAPLTPIIIISNIIGLTSAAADGRGPCRTSKTDCRKIFNFNSGWPLAWKSWKSQRIWKWSGKCLV